VVHSYRRSDGAGLPSAQQLMSLPWLAENFPAGPRASLTFPTCRRGARSGTIQTFLGSRPDADHARLVPKLRSRTEGEVRGRVMTGRNTAVTVSHTLPVEQAKGPRVAPYAGERLRTAAPRPVVVLESFTIHESQRRQWRTLSKDLQRSAVAQDGCRGSLLMTDRNDPNHYTLVSEWSDIEQFNQFMRTSGVRWRERAICPDLRGTFTILEAVR
jgi:quinol monooxygenase YgiN